LVSGRPISYQMNLYEPLYLPRPWVEPELFASLRPPVYSGSMDSQKAMEKADMEQKRPAQDSTVGGFAYKSKHKDKDRDWITGEDLLKGYLKDAKKKLSFEELQQRREEMAQKKDEAKKVGASISGLNFKEGIASVATAEELGDYYQYAIDQKVNL